MIQLSQKDLVTDKQISYLPVKSSNTYLYFFSIKSSSGLPLTSHHQCVMINICWVIVNLIICSFCYLDLIEVVILMSYWSFFFSPNASTSTGALGRVSVTPFRMSN